MKFVAAIAVVSLICFGRSVSTEDEDKDVIEFVKEVVEMCQVKLGTPNETIEEIMRGEFDEGGADADAMCQIGCMMKEFGTLENENSEAYETFISHIDDGESLDIFKTCQLETGTSDCEREYKVYLCLKANADKIFESK